MFVGQLRLAMKTKTDDGEKCYDLWFLLEGRWPNKGSVLKVKCTCLGGRDGGCKYIAAAMYSLEDLLNTCDKVKKVFLVSGHESLKQIPNQSR